MTNRTLLKLFIFSILALGLTSTGWGKDLPVVSAAVLDFHASDAKLASKGMETAQLLGAELSNAPNLMLVERQELEKALGEQELGLSGTVSPETAAQVGKLTGAKVLITGRVFGVGNKFSLVTKIMSTE